MTKQSKDKYIKIIDGEFYARLTYTDDQGKRREIKRKAENKTHAKQLVQQLQAEILQYGTKGFDTAQMTFLDLLEYYKSKYLVAPVYINDRKVSGLKSYNRVNFILTALEAFFGKKKIKSITGGDIQTYRVKRLNTLTEHKKQRTITSVNRELALLRRILTIAHREGWINKNPFYSTDKLISIADEKKRERILTKEEEILLLDSCIGIRAHLKPILICALDTGMRQGEIFSLTWADIDFERGLITVKALNTKTLQSRQIALTARLNSALGELKDATTNLDTLVFGIKNPKKAFDTLRTNAKLKDLRFHDLRHTAATRLIQQGISLQEVGRILGHTQANTTYRYINLTVDTAKRAANALDEFNASKTDAKSEEETDYIS